MECVKTCGRCKWKYIEYPYCETEDAIPIANNCLEQPNNGPIDGYCLNWEEVEQGWYLKRENLLIVALLADFMNWKTGAKNNLIIVSTKKAKNICNTQIALSVLSNTKWQKLPLN